MSLMDKLIKTSKIKTTAPLLQSTVFGKKQAIVTGIPLINLALSGKVDGGLLPGLLTIAGPSRHFKSVYALVLASAFQKQFPEGVVLFYDSEFGSPEAYFKAFDVDMDRVVHTPITNIEELKFDLSNQLDNLEKGDKVFILIDSIGNLASKKEVEDALDEKAVADMTRAKQLKSLWRIVTPHFNLKDIYCVNVNHTYKTLETYSQDVVSGGTGGIYSSDGIWIIGRQQDKNQTTKELNGYSFIINVEKSRHVKEKSKLPISVTFEGGINRWSGMFDLAKEGGFVIPKNQQWFYKINPETGEIKDDKAYRRKELEGDSKYWESLMRAGEFPKYLENMFKLPELAGLTDDDNKEVENEYDD